MDRFPVAKLSSAIVLLSDHVARSEIQVHISADARLNDESSAAVREGISAALQVCGEAGLLETKMRIEAVVAAVTRLGSSPLAASLAAEVRNIRDLLIDSCSRLTFVQIPEEFSGFVDASNLFGNKVAEKFPSAERDIREAADCLALGLGTACVFHLMRAAECSLRALARDREVEFADRPLNEKEWGQILGKLELKLTEMRSAPSSNWVTREAREPQIRFYNDAVQELRAYNDAWRKHVAHADTSAFYDSNQARSIWNHVRDFMQKLSPQISELKTTPRFWNEVYDGE
jgi:hypothetical protein